MREKRKERRKAERKWLRTGLKQDYIAFKCYRNNLNCMLGKFKTQYYSSKVEKTKCDIKKIVAKMLKGLLHVNNDVPYRTFMSSLEQAEDLSSFFYQKWMILGRCLTGPSFRICRNEILLQF